MSGRIVRDAFFDLLRERGLTTMFSNPGSTEIPLVTDLPTDLRFVLGLHEASVVGMATGFAIARDEPALVLLHTTAGLGNAVAALATARVNRAPLVVLVGQQDRRHIASEPFLTGQLAGLAGDYPVSVEEPACAQDLPSAIRRAEHEAVAKHGPALVIVPMDDWLAPADEEREPAAARRVVHAGAADPRAVDELAALLAGSERPALVVGALADDAETWAGLVQLAERLSAPVWQEAFGARAGFPQDHPLFAGHLPHDRGGLRAVLDPHDAVLCVGASAFKQYTFVEGRFTRPGVRVAVLTPDEAAAIRSSAELSVVAPMAPVCVELARRLEQRRADPPRSWRPEPLAPEATLRAGHVFDALSARLPRNAVLIEETPSTRPELGQRYAAVEPLGYLSAAMGGLGFAIPAAAGFRLARRDRPVVAVVGDGSSIYAIQGLWGAVEYGTGALYVVMSNGGYAVMDMLARLQGGSGPWPGIGHLDFQALSAGFGCESRLVADQSSLEAVLDEVIPTLADRDAPLLVEAVVAP